VPASIDAMKTASCHAIEAALAVAAFEHSPLVGMLLDGKGDVVATNRASVDLTGIPCSAMVGVPMTDLLVRRDRAAAQERIDALACGSTDSIDLHAQCPRIDGTEVAVQIHAKRLKAGSLPLRILVSITDLTQYRSMERELADSAQRLLLATEGAGIGIWDLDVISARIRLDARCQTLFGLDLADGCTAFEDWLATLEGEDVQLVRQRIAALEQPDGADHFAMDFRTRAGHEVPRRIRAQGMIYRDAAGRPLRALGANWDISQDYAQQTTVRLQAAAMDAASNAMFITNTQGQILWVNRAFGNITGYAAGETIGQTPRLLKSGRQSQQWYQTMWQTIKTGSVWRGHVINRRKDGSLFDVEQTVTPVRDERGRVVNFVAVHEDVTDRLRSEQRIRLLALYDGITGLANRTAFMEGLSAALARTRRSGKTMSVMLVDLDNFKNVNDSLGHDAGDAVLAQVASRMRKLLRETDLPARLGGDEFGVLIENVACPEQPMEMAQRLLEELRRPYEVPGYTAHIGASIGITVFPGDADSPEQLLKHADLAMYEAKRSGRDRARYFDAAMDAAAHHRFVTETALHRALHDNLLNVHYQPQFALSDGKLVGFEALLRWTDADRGPIAPAEFVPLAEQSGLILQLGGWVLRHVLAQVSAWKRQYRSPVPIAINVSAAQFEQADFDRHAAEALREHGLSSADIELEITEGVMLRDNACVRSNMRGLALRGIRLAIDDFGTGYSSLTSLRDYPVSRLKIDASFVRGIGVAGKDEQIIRAIVSLAGSLDLRVLAEGVETEAQAHFLRSVGCHEGQGFLYARPLTAGDAGALLAQLPVADERLVPA
jgi:diguanylate cyclase (GGDEF)-like protein/PAS domain S-box-containing protein